MLLEHLHPQLDVTAKQPPSTEEQIAEMLRFFPTAPTEYVDLVRTVGGLELESRSDVNFYLRLWGAEGPADMSGYLRLQHRIPGAIPIGDDMAWAALIYAIGDEGHGLYLTTYREPDPKTMLFIAPSLRAILCEGQGLPMISRSYPRPRKEVRSDVSKLVSSIDLNQNFVVLSEEPPSTEAQIAKMLRVFPKMPKEFVDLKRIVGTLELALKGDNHFYLRIWDAVRPEDMKEGHHLWDYMPGAIPVADDGGGYFIAYATGKGGYGLHLVDFGDLDTESMIYLAPSLRAILCDGVGVDIINHPHGPPPPRKPKTRAPK